MKIKLIKIGNQGEELGKVVGNLYTKSDAITPLVPTVGRCFYLDNYKTSEVKEVLSNNQFRTCNSIYKYEKI